MLVLMLIAGLPCSCNPDSSDMQACIIRTKGDIQRALELLQAANTQACMGLQQLHMLEVSCGMLPTFANS